jgi:hypothetical protein
VRAPGGALGGAGRPRLGGRRPLPTELPSVPLRADANDLAGTGDDAVRLGRAPRAS